MDSTSTESFEEQFKALRKRVMNGRRARCDHATEELKKLILKCVSEDKDTVRLDENDLNGLGLAGGS